MRQRIRQWFQPDPTPGILSSAIADGIRQESALQVAVHENRALTQALGETQDREALQREDARRFLSEIVEAQAMCGSGPWAPGSPDAVLASKPLREALQLREGGPVGDVSPLGAYGLYELLLQNVNWQREINYSWLEFTRWGIQQIILICRLYYIKNPIMRRLIDVRAQYVFARGYDVTTNDEAANAEIKAFIKRNKKVLGHVALTGQQRGKDHDGNLFWAFFTDAGTGECDLRLIDPTEIQDIWTNPEDADVPWLYQRQWTQRTHSPTDGSQATKTMQAWYPAIDYDPPEKPATINGHDVMWDTPVYHRKVGAVGKWLFGCPPTYPMVDWAKEARRFLEACASVRQSLSQFASKISTKGGQQAVEGIKQQIQTQVGPGAPIWDPNPPAVSGSTFISGPGTTLDAFKVQGATFSPEDVRQYKLMCCMVLGMPETFLGDVSTGNLATATSLDRPTETVFLSLQEEWIEDLTVIVQFMLGKSTKAAAGKLRESCAGRSIGAASRKLCTTIGGARYWGFSEAKKDPKSDIEIRVMFPAIREGDVPALVKAGVEALTLDNRGGQVVGIDERVGILWLMNQLGIENAEELIDAMYPLTGENAYDPDRSQQELPPSIPKLADKSGIQPTPAQAQGIIDANARTKPKEALKSVARRLTRALKLLEAQTDADE